MIESVQDSGVGTWRTPECPYTIEYSNRVLDDIRLAVVDAFFSLPRGGAEIGGVLLGRFGGGRVTIVDCQALDCEHATGPSFTLSKRDEAKLSELLLQAKGRPDGMYPVGWYHSHTRSDIFLSEPDIDLHKRFFPEAWQVALVLKPHVFEPTKAGFFFRDPSGTIRGKASYHEFVLDVQPMRPMPIGGAEQTPPPLAIPPRNGTPAATDHVITIEPQIAHPLVADPAPASPQPAKPVVEKFVSTEPARKEEPQAEPTVRDDIPAFAQVEAPQRPRILKYLLAMGIVAAAIGLAYQTRAAWLPLVRSTAKLHPSTSQPSAPQLALSTHEENGELQIRWDGKSPQLQKVTEGVLEIVDGGESPQVLKLDTAHLQAGSFTYSRQSERVDVTLSVDVGGGSPLRIMSSFLGKVSEHKPPSEDPAVKQERDQFRKEADKLKQDLSTQAAKTRKLEKDLEDVRQQLQREDRRRLENQAPDAVKKNQ